MKNHRQFQHIRRLLTNNTKNNREPTQELPYANILFGAHRTTPSVTSCDSLSEEGGTRRVTDGVTPKALSVILHFPTHAVHLTTDYFFCP